MVKGVTRGNKGGEFARRAIGLCPACGNTSTILAYTALIDGAMIKVCKSCGSETAKHRRAAGPPAH